MAAEGRTALASEVAKFDALAARWWDPHGPMKPLHAMNPARTRWVAERIARRGGGRLDGLSLLDVGCGAGLASEAFCSLGATVTGMDAAPEALAAARAHAEAGGLAIRYLEGGPEDLPEDERFDAVVALEVIEHVAAGDRAAFMGSLARAVKPGGMVFLSTLNRTPRSFLTAKLGAEYLLRMLPKGTHDYRKFIRPSELDGWTRAAGLSIQDLTGLHYNPLSRRYWLGPGVTVNYMTCCHVDRTA